MMRTLAFAALLTLAAPALGQDYSQEALPDPVQEAAAVELMDSLRCVVCQGQPISGSNADIAGDMRRIVRERIAAGETPEEVRAWLISRYGDFVSFKPVMQPSTLALWLVPLAALLFGVLLVSRRVKLRRK